MVQLAKRGTAYGVLAKLSPNMVPEDFMDTSEVALMYTVDTLKCQRINETYS